VHNNLGHALSITPGRLNDAIAQYGEALRLSRITPRRTIIWAMPYWKTPGRLDDAIAQYGEAPAVEAGLPRGAQ